MRAIWLNRNESNIGNGDAHSTARKSRKRPQKRQTKWLPHFFFRPKRPLFDGKIRRLRLTMKPNEEQNTTKTRQKDHAPIKSTFHRHARSKRETNLEMKRCWQSTRPSKISRNNVSLLLPHGQEPYFFTWSFFFMSLRRNLDKIPSTPKKKKKSFFLPAGVIFFDFFFLFFFWVLWRRKEKKNDERVVGDGRRRSLQRRRRRWNSIGCPWKGGGAWGVDPPTSQHFVINITSTWAWSYPNIEFLFPI